jgi:hypothetical protein
MSNQKPRDQINKASWTLMEGIKDSVTQEVTTAARTALKIEPSELAKLLMIINASVEAGFHRGSRVFTRSIDAALENVENAAWNQGNLASAGSSRPPAERPKKKQA